ncbi:MAG: phosphatidylinositol-3-phosphatase [Actinoplanes sp.]|jgi:hypothetical protein|nr:phosphatidylinositol-3-phosphatase [Actinoplanes sp.]
MNFAPSPAVPIGFLTLLLVVAGCARTPAPAPAPAGTTEAVTRQSGSPAAGRVSKILVIAEENHTYEQIGGSPRAPYLAGLARTYGSATHFEAGYPAACPSLAAYILMTSGSTHGICDDRAPRAHQLAGDNVFHQVSAAGLSWRAYAESAPSTCALADGAGGRYLVRHVPATYYLDVRTECSRAAVPLRPALAADVAAGSLPSFGFVSPDACNDMHGAAGCQGDEVGVGDRWLQATLPGILAGPDYRAGRLAVIVTWDEGSATSNHIPTLVIAPGARGVSTAQAFSHCSTLRTVEDLLRLPRLGCAVTAASMVTAFHL